MTDSAAVDANSEFTTFSNICNVFTKKNPASYETGFFFSLLT
jgi:hypothetical protein